MQTVKVIDDADLHRWDAFVDCCRDATSSHRYGWRKVIEKSFGHSAHYLAAYDGAGEISGVLPLVHMKSALFGSFLVSVPFLNYGGLLCKSEETRGALLDAAEKLRQSLGAQHVELRHLGFSVEGLPSREQKVTMMLPLLGEVESQWNAFNAKLRNQVRKAEKSGLASRIGGVELLDDFYRVFARNMRDLGTPVYAKRFFLNVLETFPAAARIVAVSLGEKVIAAGILFRYRESMEMPWASAVAEYKTLCPNNMLYWEAIKYAIETGCTRFDFGRSTPNEGTFNFKKQWGAEPVQLYWQYLQEVGRPLPELSPKNPKYEAAIRLWKRLPVALTKVIGPGIVRNIP